MLRLTILEIFAVKWSKIRPKVWDFGVPLGLLPRKSREDLSMTHIYHHAKFCADRSHCRRDTFKSSVNLVPCRTNIWQVVNDGVGIISRTLGLPNQLPSHLQLKNLFSAVPGIVHFILRIQCTI